jgi:Cu-Zn family superoxide dismutase
MEQNMTRTLAILACGFLLSACATTTGSQPGVAPVPASVLPQPTASASLKNNAGATVGKVDLWDGPRGVLMRFDAKGLPPGWHGLHVHDMGHCTGDFTSAGAHMKKGVHGLLAEGGPEAGDLPNLHVDADGTAHGEFFSSWLSVSGVGGRPAMMDMDGAAIVIHAAADDHATQPIGGAGARIACGVVQLLGS